MSQVQGEGSNSYADVRYVAEHDGYESASFDAVRLAVEHLIAVVEMGGLWRIGDGYGGWVLDTVREVASERGMPGRPPRVRPSYVKVKVPTEVRWLVWERDDFSCRHCGARTDLTLDHVHPESLGGSSEPENLQTLCRPCNTRKGRRP